MGLVQSFCCGCSLQQGTIVSGVVSTIRGLLSIVAGLFALININPHLHDDYLDMPRPTSSHAENSRRIVIAAGSIALCIGLIVLIVSGLLFLGIAKRKPGYLLPWIVWQSIEFFFATCLFILRCAGGDRLAFPDKGGGPFSIVLMVYLYIVVLSYYKFLQGPPPTQIPVASMQMTQINIAPGGYSQPGYVVSLAGPASPMPPMSGYDPRSPGMMGPGIYDPRMGPMLAYDPVAGPGMAPMAAGDMKMGMAPQYAHNPEYTPNPPPPYPPNPPPPYSQV